MRTDTASNEPAIGTHPDNDTSAMGVSVDPLLDLEPMPEPGIRPVVAESRPGQSDELFKTLKAGIEEKTRRLALGRTRELRDTPDPEPWDWTETHSR